MWNAERKRPLSAQMTHYLQTVWGIDVDHLEKRYLYLPYRDSLRRTAVIGVAAWTPRGLGGEPAALEAK